MKQRKSWLIEVHVFAQAVVNSATNTNALVGNMLHRLPRNVEEPTMPFIGLCIEIKFTYRDTKCNTSFIFFKRNEEVYHPNEAERTPANRSTHFD